MKNETSIQTIDYPIIISKNAGKEIDAFLSSRDYSSLYILMDENVMEHCWPILFKETELLRNAEILLIEAGENQKNIEILTQLWHTLSEYQADRSSLIINFGGGVVSDLGGFLASTFKRGLEFINIPTTLLAMVDASIGGKTGINLQHYKNQIGTFNTPQAIFIQYDFLESLEKRHITNGFAEMLKHGLIADASYWNELSNISNPDTSSLADFVEKSILIKKAVVEQDPLEIGIRKSLNFGHTIGHIFESWSLENDSDPILHGEAVAIGLLIESHLSVQKAGLKMTDFEIIRSTIIKYFDKYNISTPFFDNIENMLNQDKKKKGKKLNFTFVSEIGAYVIDQNCSIEDIRESISYYKENC